MLLSFNIFVVGGGGVVIVEITGWTNYPVSFSEPGCFY